MGGGGVCVIYVEGRFVDKLLRYVIIDLCVFMINGFYKLFKYWLWECNVSFLSIV